MSVKLVDSRLHIHVVPSASIPVQVNQMSSETLGMLTESEQAVAPKGKLTRCSCTPLSIIFDALSVANQGLCPQIQDQTLDNWGNQALLVCCYVIIVEIHCEIERVSVLFRNRASCSCHTR